MKPVVERLNGDLRLPSGGLAPAHLVLDADGLWLRDHTNPKPEVRVAVLDARPLGYLVGTFGDELKIGDRAYGVPPGRAEAVRRLFAHARLPSPSDRELPRRERFLDRRSDLEDRWLRGWLEPDEPLLAWLRLGKKTRVESKIGPAEELAGALALTTRRQALVAVGSLGDVKERPLEAIGLEVGDGRRRPVLSGSLQFYAAPGNGDRFLVVAPWLGLDGPDRAFALARALMHDEEVPDARRVRLLAYAADARPDADVLRALWAGDEETPGGVRALLSGEDPRGALFALWDGWPVGPERGAQLVRWARAAGVERAAQAVVELHDHVHRARLAAAKGGFTPAAIDLDFADHLIAERRFGAAIELLESRLLRLPSEELADLIPSEASEDDLDAGHGGQIMRIAILDRLAEARGRGGRRDADTVAELARLMPLSPNRLVELAGSEGTPAATRARAYREKLAARRWTQPAPPLDAAAVHALSEADVEQALRHPLSRKGHALGALSGLLAEVDVPDVTSLRAYCERLGAARADAHNALSDAMVALSVARCDAYVSRGDKSVGLRSYEGDDPFVLIGAEHLDEGSARHLGAAELRFALGAELAHLRFGHSRVTSTDIWLGALNKSKRGFDAIAGLLPAWRMLKVAEKASTLASYYQDGTVEWALTKIGKLTGWSPFGEGPHDRRLSADPEDMIAAARVMQLTADRAGLLLCDDLHAAVRAICLTHADYDGVLAAADVRSLSEVLAERDEDGEPRRQTLAIRVAALIAFHLSDEWDTLRAALAAGPADADAV